MIGNPEGYADGDERSQFTDLPAFDKHRAQEDFDKLGPLYRPVSPFDSRISFPELRFTPIESSKDEKGTASKFSISRENLIELLSLWHAVSFRQYLSSQQLETKHFENEQRNKSKSIQFSAMVLGAILVGIFTYNRTNSESVNSDFEHCISSSLQIPIDPELAPEEIKRDMAGAIRECVESK